MQMSGGNDDWGFGRPHSKKTTLSDKMRRYFVVWYANFFTPDLICISIQIRTESD